MNHRAVIYAFTILLAASLNFDFFVGQIDDPAEDDIRQLFAAVVVSPYATALKVRDRTQDGGVVEQSTAVLPCSCHGDRWKPGSKVALPVQPLA